MSLLKHAGVQVTRGRRDAVAAWLLIAFGLGGLTLSGLAIPRGGIGWDAGIDSFAAQNVRGVDGGSSLAQAYEQVFSTSEFYGVLIQWAADAINELFGGSASLAIDMVATYQLQAAVSLTLFAVSAIAAGLAVFVLFSSRVAGAFTFAAISTLPFLSGMAIINFKDAPVAAGLTLASTGGALLWRSRGWRWLGFSAALIAAGTFVALGVRISSWVLVGAVLGLNVIAIATWRFVSNRQDVLIAPALATVLGVGTGLFGLWLLSPIARIDLPRWAWDAFVVSRSYPWIGEVRTLGQDLPSTDLPWWYIPAWFFAQMPVLFLGFALLGLLVWLKWAFVEVTHARSIDVDGPRAIALVPLAVQALALPAGLVVLGATLYDGIRHVTFAIPALIVLMAPLVVRLTEGGTTGKEQKSRTAWLMMAVLIAVPATNLVLSARWFPYMYAHVNVPTAALDSDRDWEYDYWGASVLEGAQRLREIGVDTVVVLPEIDPRGTAEVAQITSAQDAVGDDPYGLYVFRRYDASIPETGCERVFEIKRAGVILGEGAICQGNASLIP